MRQKIVFVCPKTKKKLRRLVGKAVSSINELLRQKKLQNAAGQRLKGPISAIWLREDGEIFYVERKKIPVLLVDESVVVSQLSPRELKAELKEELERWMQNSPR